MPIVLAVGLIHLIVVIAAVGLIVWLITTYIPMPDVFKKVIYVVCAIALIILLLKILLGATGDINL